MRKIVKIASMTSTPPLNPANLWEPKNLHEEEGILLRLTPHSERGQVAQVLFKANGLRPVFIGKKSTPRFAARQDLRNILCPARADFSFRIASEHHMPKVEHLEVTDGFLALGADPVQWGRAAYLLEITEGMLAAGCPEPELYRDLGEALSVLAGQGGGGALLRAFELRLLRTQGLLAPLATWVPQERLAEATALVTGPLTELPVLPVDVQKQFALPFVRHWREMGLPPTKSAQYLKQFQ